MVAYVNKPNSTSVNTTPAGEINSQHVFFKIVIVGDDVRTAKNQMEYDNINLHMREQEILRQQEKIRKKELDKNKPKEKWYKKFEKHKGYHYRVR